MNDLEAMKTKKWFESGLNRILKNEKYVYIFTTYVL